MAHPFEIRDEIELDATPEEVWEAVATGPGTDAWFMGSNEIDPRVGGAARTVLPGFTIDSKVTVWDPPHRIVTQSEETPDGGVMAFEFIIEGRAGGKTLLRFVHSGFLAGDDWEAEYDALKGGDPMYIRKLGAYVTYFRGRRATPVSAYGPSVDEERAMHVFRAALGLGSDVHLGDRARFASGGLELDGVVDETSAHTIGVRTDDGLFRFIHGLGGAVVVGHHVFADVDQPTTERAWQAWLDGAFA
jgi:uncharacterized protein YndB with AHSA1/START domain